jgi:hypothetical protein
MPLRKPPLDCFQDDSVILPVAAHVAIGAESLRDTLMVLQQQKGDLQRVIQGKGELASTLVFRKNPFRGMALHY